MVVFIGKLIAGAALEFALQAKELFTLSFPLLENTFGAEVGLIDFCFLDFTAFLRSTFIYQ